VVSTDTPRVGVLGSLCNPVHLGHLLLCQEATWQLGLSRVVLVPTGMPPHRPAPEEPPAMRLRLAQAAAIGNPALTVSRVEIERPGPSYMVDTLRELAQRYPGNGLVLLLGSDQFAALSTWHQPELVPRLARIAPASRWTCSPTPTSTASRCRRSTSRRR
jgi:nicotinate-nucleotide adenylyltransferase